jgi:hypothetical protein
MSSWSPLVNCRSTNKSRTIMIRHSQHHIPVNVALACIDPTPHINVWSNYKLSDASELTSLVTLHS